MGAELERHRPARPGDRAGVLAGIAERSVRERPTRLKEKKRRPETLSDAEVQQILDACDRLRDRLLMSVMFETGCRIGQALGMRHEDISTDGLTITLQPRENNANRARGKSRDPRQIPVRRALLDLHADYLFGEDGELRCHYLLVPLPNGPAVTALT